jgi:poly-beta-1,6-N-acetyl-D-glucosamine N-deacetylase
MMPNQKLIFHYADRSKARLKWLRFSLGVGLLALSLSILAAKKLEVATKVNATSYSTALPPATSPNPSPNFSSVLTATPASYCHNQQHASNRLTQLTGEQVQTLGAAAPGANIEEFLSSLGLQVLMSTQLSSFPALNERARLTKVPVIMYHDVLTEQQVFFDITPENLRRDFELIRENNLTPITLDQLVVHLRTGLPLPEKPILLTFDDGYVGHYQSVYPLLKEYGYPAVFSLFTGKLDGSIVGRSTVTWEQVREMAANPLVTIAAHSLTHPSDLTKVPDDQIRREVTESKRILEERLGMPIRYFTYPEGHYDARVAELVEAAGYQAALTMDTDQAGRFAGESESMLAIARFGKESLEDVLQQAWGGAPMPLWGSGFDFASPVERRDITVDGIPLLLAAGGRPETILADSRYQVQDILAGTEAIAGVDGAFFSMKYLDSNVMIGPVLSQSTGQFIPGERGVIPVLNGRPLVLISPTAIKFAPFDATRHNSLTGVQAELSDVTDAFVGAAMVVKEGAPQPGSMFGSLPNFEVPRQRAFWGTNAAGQPIIGITNERVDAVELGVLLAKAGFWNAVMLDSGASTSMVYEGDSLVGFIPRPVPHVVALMPPLPCEASTQPAP